MVRVVLVVALAAVVVVQAAMAQRPGMQPAVAPPSLPTTPPAPAPAVVAPPLPPLTPPPAIVPPALPPPPPLPAIVPPALPPTPAIVPPALPPMPAIVPPALPSTPPRPAIVPPSLPPTPPPTANLPCVAELALCSKFYQNALAKPTKACCTPLKKAYESELGCLCSVLTNPSMVAAVGVDMKKGLDLFGRCGVKVPADVCSSHAPAPAPASSPPTSSPNSDSSALMVPSGWHIRVSGAYFWLCPLLCNSFFFLAGLQLAEYVIFPLCMHVDVRSWLPGCPLFLGILCFLSALLLIVTFLSKGVII